MSVFRFNKRATPATPAASKGDLFYSSSLTPNGLAFINEAGEIIRVGGLISVRHHASGTTFTPTVGTKALYVECIGGGGAGGGGVTGAVSTSAGTGGGGGAYSAEWVTGSAVKTSYTVAVGAAGSPGAAGNNPGGAGGDTTFDSPSICTAKGGSGGPAGGVAAATSLILAGAAGGAAASGVGDSLHAGAPGECSIRLSAAIAKAGNGGNGPHAGGGGIATVAQGAGAAGTGFGSGGAGGIALNGGASVAGGAGTAGLIRVWEFG